MFFNYYCHCHCHFHPHFHPHPHPHFHYDCDYDYFYFNHYNKYFPLYQLDQTYSLFFLLYVYSYVENKFCMRFF